MKKKSIVLSSIALAVILGLGACESTDRYNRHEVGAIQDDTTIGDDNGIVVTNPEPFVPITPDNGGSIAQPTDGNQTENQYKTINGVYSIKITPEFDSITSGQTQNVHYEITNFFTKKPADDRVITYMNLEIDKRYAEFFDENGNHGNIIEFGKGTSTAKSTGDVALKSNSKSGQLLVNFNAVIDGTDINLTKSLPIVIEKNKSSSMAIVPLETTYANGLFTEKFVIHVVDSYGNKAKDGTKISTGVVNNPKLYSRAYDTGISEKAGVAVSVKDPELPTSRWGEVSKLDFNLYETATDSGQRDDDNNTIFNYAYTLAKTVGYDLKNDKGLLNKTTGKFTLPGDQNTSVISPLDTLIVLANEEQHKPYNLGGWDISAIDDDKKQLSLYDLDLGNEGDISGVSYVIGDEYRYDRCNETLMNAAASSFTSTEVTDGVAYAELRYTPAMVGKNIFIYANSKLEDRQIGISRKVILTGTGLETATLTCKNESPEGSSKLVSCSKRFRMVQTSSGKIARDVYIAQPTTVEEANYYKATATKTDCDGWTTVSIYGVPATKTATVTFGDYISNELIVNKR